MLSKSNFLRIKQRVNSIHPQEAREDVKALVEHIEKVNIFSDVIKEDNSITKKFPYHALPGISHEGNWLPENYSDALRNKFQAMEVKVTDRIDSTIMSNLKAIGIKFILGRIHNIYDSGNVDSLYDFGVRYFSLGDQPNDAAYGMFSRWKNGKEFSDLFLREVEYYKEDFPEIQLGFPGLALGNGIADVRYNGIQFIEEAAEAVERADFMNLYSCWGIDNTLDEALDDIFQFCANYFTKTVFIVGFSINDNMSYEEEIENYAKFFKSLKEMPSNLGAAFLVW